MGVICGIPPLQTCWAGFWVIKIPPLLTSTLQSHGFCPKRHVGSCSPAWPPVFYLHSLSLSLLPNFSLRHHLPLRSSTHRCGANKYSLTVQIYTVAPRLYALLPPSRFQFSFQLTFLSAVSALFLSLSFSPAKREEVFSAVSLLFNSEMMKQTK